MVDMDPMNQKLVQRWLEDHKAGILSLLGVIMVRGKGYTSRRGGGVTTMGSEDHIK